MHVHADAVKHTVCVCTCMPGLCISCPGSAALEVDVFQHTVLCLSCSHPTQPNPSFPVPPHAEGFELHVLKGATNLLQRHNVWYIQLECNKGLLGSEAAQLEYFK